MAKQKYFGLFLVLLALLAITLITADRSQAGSPTPFGDCNNEPWCTKTETCEGDYAYCGPCRCDCYTWGGGHDVAVCYP